MPDSCPQGDTARINTMPDVPEPPNSDIETAARDVAPIMADVKTPLPGLKIVLIASELVGRLVNKGHKRYAALWAVHRLVKKGKLSAEQRRMPIPGSIAALGFIGELATSTTCPDGYVLVDIPKTGRTPFQLFQVVATESLWREWREREASKAAPPADAAERLSVSVINIGKVLHSQIQQGYIAGNGGKGTAPHTTRWERLKQWAWNNWFVVAFLTIATVVAGVVALVSGLSALCNWIRCFIVWPRP